MAGIFVSRVKVFNRAPVPLAVFFDGERSTLAPGMNEIPAVTVYMAKNQNPIMGTGQADNPHQDGTQYLVVEEVDEGFGVPLTEQEWAIHLDKPCRVDEEAAFAESHINDPKARLIVRGKGKKSTAANRYEAGSMPKGNADFTHRDA
jgi:hypothetical protein